MAKREGANINLELDLSSLIKGVPLLNKRLDRGVRGVFLYRDSVAEGWMRENAPWTDRTGNARSGLSAEVESEPFVRHTLHLFHRVPYGIWLEVRNSGRYAIVIPAILDQGVKLMKSLNKLFDRLGKTP